MIPTHKELYTVLTTVFAGIAQMGLIRASFFTTKDKLALKKTLGVLIKHICLCTGPKKGLHLLLDAWKVF
jgi:hypothetical protein